MMKFPTHATINTYATSAHFCAYAERSWNRFINVIAEAGFKTVKGGCMRTTVVAAVIISNRLRKLLVYYQCYIFPVDT
jgi:hypothetical protein